MTEALHPDALKHYRTKRGLSQEQLATESKVSKIQISRYERGLQNERVGKTNRDKLCKALRVNWETLTQPPDKDEADNVFNRVALKASIAGEAKTALTFVQIYFGLKEDDILDLAPIASLILLARSLNARKTALEGAMEAIEEATDNARSRLPYLRYAFPDNFDLEWIEAEQTSLKQRNVFEEYVADDGEEGSPFVRFLEAELDDLNLFKKHAIEIVSSWRGAPSYAIPIEILAQLVGLDALDESDRRVLDLIQDGRIDLAQALEKKQEATEEDHRLWLDEQRRAIDLAIEEKRKTLPRTHFLAGLRLGEKDDSTSDVSSGDDTKATSQKQGART